MFLVATSLVVIFLLADLGRRGEVVINMTVALTISIIISYSLTFI
jgi:hypothetical protein